MENYKKRLIFSFTINLLMIILFISSIIWEIVDINNDPNSVYQNFWGLFRYFTIDGNLLSCIFNFIIAFKQFQALRMQTESYVKEKTISHFLYIISLISAVDEIIIFIVVMIIFLPMSDIKMINGRPFNPHSQGVVERVHRTIRNSLIVLIKSNSNVLKYVICQVF